MTKLEAALDRLDAAVRRVHEQHPRLQESGDSVLANLRRLEGGEDDAPLVEALARMLEVLTGGESRLR